MAALLPAMNTTLGLDWCLASHGLEIGYFRGFGTCPTSLHLLYVSFWLHACAVLVTGYGASSTGLVSLRFSSAPLLLEA